MNYRIKISMLLWSILCLFALPTVAIAAQDALVSQDKAEIHELRDSGSPVIETLSLGEKVRVSTKQKDGWYKIQSKSGKFGWISQISLSILNETTFNKKSEMELTTDRDSGNHIRKPFFQLLVGGLFGEFVSPNTTSAIGASSKHLYPTEGGLLEGSFRLSDLLSLAIRVMYLGSISKISGYTISQSGTPLLLGANFDLYYTLMWDITCGIYAGADLHGTTTISDNLNGSNFEDIFQSGYFASMVKVKSRHWLTKQVSLFYELGLYFSRGSTQQLAQPYYSYANGTITIGVLEQLGPFLDLGFQFTF
jgi:uncharacterized protein YgiM (DUF1202 family)